MTTREVVVFPGHLCNERMYRPLVRDLSDIATFHVADLYGFDSVGAMADDALRKAPSTFVLLANSMGGAVAFEALRRAPERIEALILMGTTAQPEFLAQSSRRAKAIELLASEDWSAISALYAPVFFFEQNREQNPGLDRTLEAMIRDLDAQRIRGQQRAFSARADSRPTLSKIKCRTLVLCGRQDGITPLSHSEEMAAGIPEADLTVFESCGHIPTLEQPQATSKAIRHWLSNKSGV